MNTLTGKPLDVGIRLILEDLISSYCHTYDNKDAAGFAALFLPDATFQAFNAGQLVMDGKLDEEMIKLRMKMHEDEGIQTRHYQTNPLFTMRDDGRVAATINLLVQHQHADEPAPITVHTGTYEDIFEETADGWKYASHEIRIDHR